MSRSKGVLRQKINALVKTGNISTAIQKLKRIIRFRWSLLFNGRKNFVREIDSIEKQFNSSRDNSNYQQSAEAVLSLLNLTDKLDRTRSNLGLIWVPVSFILLTIAGIFITNIVEGEPELFDCGGTNNESCAVLISPFGGTENDIDQVLFQIFNDNQDDWYSVHNLSTNSPEGDKYYFLENTVYQSCKPKIMIYGQGNEGPGGMDIDLKLFSLDYPIKESLDLEDTQYFTVPGFSERYLSDAIESERFISTLESYLMRVCDMPVSHVKANVELVTKTVRDPNLRLFSFQNFAEFFAAKKDFKNAERMLTNAIESNKNAFDSYAMRGLMRDKEGENYLGAYADYSQFLKFSPQNNTVRKRRFRSIEKHVQSENTLSKKMRANVIEELTKDLGIIRRLNNPSDRGYIKDLSNFLDQLNNIDDPLLDDPDPEPVKTYLLKGQILDYSQLREAKLRLVMPKEIVEIIQRDGSFEFSTSTPEVYIGKQVKMHAIGYKSGLWQIQELNFNPESPLILSLEPSPIDDQEKMYLLKGHIQNYPNLKEAGLKVIIAKELFENINNDGDFEIATSTPEVYFDQLIEMHADGFQSNRWQLKESHFNSATPLILSLKALPRDDVIPQNSMTISLCPFLKGVKSIINFEDRRRKPESFDTPEFSFSYEKNFRLAIQDKGEPIEYTVDKLSDLHWKIILVANPMDIRIFYKNELLSGEKNMALHLVNSLRESFDLDLTRFSSRSNTKPQVVETLPLKWNRRNQAYINEIFSISKLCEIQENRWTIYLTDGRQNELFKPLKLTEKHIHLGENKIEIGL